MLCALHTLSHLNYLFSQLHRPLILAMRVEVPGEAVHRFKSTWMPCAQCTLIHLNSLFCQLRRVSVLANSMMDRRVVGCSSRSSRIYVSNLPSFRPSSLLSLFNSFSVVLTPALQETILSTCIIVSKQTKRRNKWQIFQ